MTTLAGVFGGRIATVVPAVVGALPAAELRARLERAGYVRYELLDRGSYAWLGDPREPELFDALIAIAGEVTGRALVVAEARALRLGPGDYLLAHHDAPRDELRVELMLDLSPVAVAGAEVHYRRRGQVVFRVPCTPGALSIVERGPVVSCNHTYVSKLHAGASIVRLVVGLRDRS